VTWIKKKIGPGIYNITTVDDAERLLTSETKLVLGFLNSLVVRFAAFTIFRFGLVWFGFTTMHPGFVSCLSTYDLRYNLKLIASVSSSNFLSHYGSFRQFML
jgi:hypothetical protein